MTFAASGGKSHDRCDRATSNRRAPGVIIGLRDSKDHRAVVPLTALEDPDTDVRREAVITLPTCGCRAVRRCATVADPDATCARLPWCAGVLLTARRCSTIFIRSLADPDWRVRVGGRNRARPLGAVRGGAVFARSAERRLLAGAEGSIASLGRLGAAAAAADLIDFTGSRWPTCAARQLTRSANSKAREHVPRLRALVSDPDVEVRKAATRASKPSRAAPALRTRTTDNAGSARYRLGGYSLLAARSHAEPKPEAPTASSAAPVKSRRQRRPSASPLAPRTPTINCATGGPLVRELHLLEKYLPKTGKYENVKYDIEWENQPTGAQLNSKYLANQLDIVQMADFPSVLGATALKAAGRQGRSLLHRDPFRRHQRRRQRDRRAERLTDRSRSGSSRARSCRCRSARPRTRC